MTGPSGEFTGLLALAHVRQCMWEAWQDSQPDDPVDRHEEGGYFVRYPDGSIGCVRWPSGDDDEIIAPELANGTYLGFLVISEFHTHPYPPPHYQDPSEIDLNAIYGRNYQAESFVISVDVIYHVEPNGLTIELPVGAGSLNTAPE